MQQIFTEPSARSSLAADDDEGRLQVPLIQFPVLPGALPERSDLVVKKRGTTSRSAPSAKRRRDADEPPTAESPEGKSNSTPAASPDLQQAVRNFMEFGDQPSQPSSVLMKILSGRTNPAALLDHSRRAAPGNAKNASETDRQSSRADIEKHRALTVAVRQALAVVARVVRLDSAGAFLLSLPSEPKRAAPASPLPAPPSAEPSTAAPRDEQRTHHGLLRLYCFFGGLELELDDLAPSVGSSAPLPATTVGGGRVRTEDGEAQDQWRQTHRRAVRAVDALESTVLAVVLDEDRFVGRDAPSRAYVEELLQSIPAAFREESWPVQLVGTPDPSLFARDDLAAVSSAQGEVQLHAVLPAALRKPLEGGVAAVLLSAVRDVHAADCTQELRVGGHAETPVSALAARLPQRSGVERSPLMKDGVSFGEIAARAWRGDFGQQGLRRANVEVGAFFTGLLLAGRDAAANSRAPSAAASSARPKQRRESILQLKNIWAVSLARHYARFLASTGVECTDGTEVPLITANVLDAERTARDGATRLTTTQEAAVRVLRSLKTVDKENWFAIPAFDLANTDFTSVRLWIESPGFAEKSGRDAFDALRHVLERMVDSCVRKYGPTHKFSICIVSVRQQLVDSARQEGLLR